MNDLAADGARLSKNDTTGQIASLGGDLFMLVDGSV
jgi:hypothetical protein